MKDFDLLNAWLGRLEQEVLNLALDEKVFWRVQEIIEQNSALQVPSEYYGWLGRMYVAGMSMAIRRQVDDDSRTDSMVRFLNRLKGSVGVISRTHYRNLYPVGQSAEADRVYDRFVGRDAEHPSAARIERRIRALRRLSRNITAYGDKAIAHTDRDPPTVVPKFQEVGRVIRCLELIVQRYFQLFRGIHWDPHVTIAYDWEAPFRIAWLGFRPVNCLTKICSRRRSGRRHAVAAEI